MAKNNGSMAAMKKKSEKQRKINQRNNAAHSRSA
jgi:hypothetical protein